MSDLTRQLRACVIPLDCWTPTHTAHYCPCWNRWGKMTGNHDNTTPFFLPTFLLPLFNRCLDALLCHVPGHSRHDLCGLWLSHGLLAPLWLQCGGPEFFPLCSSHPGASWPLVGPWSWTLKTCSLDHQIFLLSLAPLFTLRFAVRFIGLPGNFTVVAAHSQFLVRLYR